MERSAERNMDKGSVRDFTAHKAHEMRESLHDVQDMVKSRSSEFLDDSVNLVKRYPLSTAIGAAAIGFIAGVFLGNRK